MYPRDTMLPKQYIQDLEADAYVQSTFLVTSKQIKQTRQGDDFLATTLTDRTGSIEARAWENVEILSARFDAGVYVAISAVVTAFQDINQLRLLDLEVLDPDQVDPTDYLPSSQWKPDRMFEQLVELFETNLSSSHMREFVRTLFAQTWLMESFRRSAAATRNHHAFLGGLLEHVLSMARVAVGLAKHYGHYYPGLINQDLVLVGCLLHDLGKCRELSADRTIAYTDEGKLIGHIAQGVELIDAVTAQMHPAPPQDMILHLKHLVLSHHGRLEYGSPVQPQTPEAHLLHQIDMIDSRMNMCWQAVAPAKAQGSTWTPYIKTLGSKLYLGHPDARAWVGPVATPALAGPGLAQDDAWGDRPPAPPQGGARVQSPSPSSTSSPSSEQLPAPQARTGPSTLNLFGE